LSGAKSAGLHELSMHGAALKNSTLCSCSFQLAPLVHELLGRKGGCRFAVLLLLRHEFAVLRGIYEFRPRSRQLQLNKNSTLTSDARTKPNHLDDLASQMGWSIESKLALLTLLVTCVPALFLWRKYKRLNNKLNIVSSTLEHHNCINFHRPNFSHLRQFHSTPTNRMQSDINSTTLFLLYTTSKAVSSLEYNCNILRFHQFSLQLPHQDCFGFPLELQRHNWANALLMVHIWDR
jgi:hypothetical protein